MTEQERRTQEARKAYGQNWEAMTSGEEGCNRCGAAVTPEGMCTGPR
jgi:hypothetical protein